MKERHMLFSNYQKTVIGGKEMGKYETLAKDIVKAYLDAEFLGGRHQTRIDLIHEIEERNS